MTDLSSATKRTVDEVQAHRGASAVAPENTLAAFRAAREQGRGGLNSTWRCWATARWW
ncbi:glycerophosphoryl diester phosphodiesterase [Devosia sp. UYZn731]